MGSKTRVTIETLASGQPRPYADHELRVRVTFEWTGWRGGEEFGPMPMAEERVREWLPGLRCGFVGATRAEAGFMGSYLSYLRPVDARTAADEIPGGDPRQIVASVWEFEVVTPYAG